MKIQTLSIVVPAGCPNNCKFCVIKIEWLLLGIMVVIL